MNKKIAKLIITDIWKDKKLIEVLEKAGYILTLDYESFSEEYYIISEPMKEGRYDK